MEEVACWFTSCSYRLVEPFLTSFFWIFLLIPFSFFASNSHKGSEPEFMRGREREEIHYYNRK